MGDGADRLAAAVIDAYASHSNYIDHLAPVLARLPGYRLRVPSRVLASWAHRRGLTAQVLPPGDVRVPPPEGPVLVAAYRDEVAFPGSPIVLLEHGAGQHYGGHDPSSRGGERGNVVLYLAPGAVTAARMATVLTEARVVAVGCPRLDRHVLGPPAAPERPVVGFAWHWPSRTWPEASWAWPHYRRAVVELAGGPWTLLGHGHPRALAHLAGHYRRAGIPTTADVEAFLDMADLVVADNTSVMWEAAAIGKPLVLLDAPWYRRGVEHGLRFWRWADVGPRIDHPSQLREAIARSWHDREQYRPVREAMRDEVYGPWDGRAAERAAAAVAELVG